MIKLENITRICETKIHVMIEAYTPDELLYCRNVCQGIDEIPCPFGKYKPVGNSIPLRKGKIAYEMERDKHMEVKMRIEK